MANKNNLSYIKQTKELELYPKQEQSCDTSYSNSKDLSSVLSLKGYEKTDGILSYNIVCVISGGEKKEKDFLKELIKNKNLHSLRIAFLTEECQGLQPYQMQEKWTNIQQYNELEINGNNYYLDIMDKVYLLTDVDEYYDQLVKIINTKEKNDAGQWIISNPCFEIWLYYCFKKDPLTDLFEIKNLTPDKRSKKMKSLGNNLVNGGLNPITAFINMKDGISHSYAHFGIDENNIPVLYATQMHEMAQYLIEIMNRNSLEYDNFVKKQREWRNIMKKNK